MGTKGSQRPVDKWSLPSTRYLGVSRSRAQPGSEEGTCQACWASLGAPLVKNLPAIQETLVQSLGWEDSPGEGKGYPLQYSGLENSMDCIVHGVAKSWTQLTFTRPY